MADTKRKVRKKRSYAIDNFHRLCSSLAKKNEQDDITSMERLVEDIENAYTEVKSNNLDYLIELDSEDEDDKIKINEVKTDEDTIFDQLLVSRSLYTNKKNDQQTTSKKNDQQNTFGGKVHAKIDAEEIGKDDTRSKVSTM